MKRLLLSFLASFLVLTTPGCQFADAMPEKAVVKKPPFVVDAATPVVVRYIDMELPWEKIDFVKPDDQLVAYIYRDLGAVATHYLWEGIWRMTGQKLHVTGGKDFSKGIVLLTLAQAPDDLKKDPEVIRALADDGTDSYNANEAYLVRSETNRVVVIANTVDGLSDGIVALMESVGYETLGVGPNWTHTPDFHRKPLAFAVSEAGRPGFYCRYLQFVIGQTGGNGTLSSAARPRVMTDPADETVITSTERWSTGTRSYTRSMPPFLGHALHAYHHEVIKAMLARKSTDGFLVPDSHIGLDAERPAPSEDNGGDIWISSDAPGTPGAGKVYYSMITRWDEKPNDIPNALDLTVPFVREIILSNMIQQAEINFTRSPNDLFIFGTDVEDGSGYANFPQAAKNTNWYPQYLASEKVPFGKPYVLNGFKGLNQPKEIWDGTTPNDTVFAFNNWLLREFDKYINSLPEKDRVTATGKSKKELVRTSMYSYNYHDVPPNFNLDPRLRLMIAGYPKYRGTGKWKKFASQIDMGQAFKIMLPREPSGDYWILSQAFYSDPGAWSIKGSDSAANIQQTVHNSYNAGFKALDAEIDLNFGKKGLEYYLYTKMLWDPTMSVKQLEAIRTRWLQRAFGTGWREMKEYYDFMTPERFAINSPQNWAKAIRLIDVADGKIADDSVEQKRLDDLKQYWYFYYFTESGQTKPASREFREFVWKGQMSYMTAMHMVTMRFFESYDADAIAGPEFNQGRAHYTHEETQKWWAKVLDFWKVTPVDEFSNATLNNGKKASQVDLYDVVNVKEFNSTNDGPTTYDGMYQYDSSEWRAPSFLTTAKAADEEIGFKLLWPWRPKENSGQACDVHYGISRWDPEKKRWEELVDQAMTSAASEPTPPVAWGSKEPQQMATARFKVPSGGAYRIEVGKGGSGAVLASLAFNEMTGDFSSPRSQTYFGSLLGYTQVKAFFYIPKGTKSLDMEVWNAGATGQIEIFTGLPSTGMKLSRTLPLPIKPETLRIPLQPGEAGSLATFYGANFGFPYLYSVPILWAKSPSVLLIPRAIAEADGLTISK